MAMTARLSSLHFLLVMLCFSLILAQSFQYHRGLHDLRSLNLRLNLTCFSLQTNRPYRSKPKVGITVPHVCFLLNFQGQLLHRKLHLRLLRLSCLRHSFIRYLRT